MHISFKNDHLYHFKLEIWLTLMVRADIRWRPNNCKCSLSFPILFRHAVSKNPSTSRSTQNFHKIKQCVENIWIQLNIQVFSTEYRIIKYEYWNYHKRIYSDRKYWQSLNILLFEHLFNKMFFDSLKQKFKWLWADYSLLKHSESRIRKSKKPYFIPKMDFFW